MPNGSSSYYSSGNLHHVFNQSQSNAQNYFNHTSNRGNGKLPRGHDAEPQLSHHHRQQHQQVNFLRGLLANRMVARSDRYKHFIRSFSNKI